MFGFKRRYKRNLLKSTEDVCALDAWAMREECKGNTQKAEKIKKTADKMFNLQSESIHLGY